MSLRIFAAALLWAAGISYPHSDVQAGAAAAPMENTESASVAGYAVHEYEAFVAATVALGRIQESYRTNVKAVQSPKEAEIFPEAANVETMRAIEREGLTVDRYNEMAEAVTTDPLIAEQLNRYLQHSAD